MSTNVTLLVSEALANWLIIKCDSPTCGGCDALCLFEEVEEISFPAGEDFMQTFWYCSPECLETISRRMEAKP